MGRAYKRRTPVVIADDAGKVRRATALSEVLRGIDPERIVTHHVSGPKREAHA